MLEWNESQESNSPMKYPKYHVSLAQQPNANPLNTFAQEENFHFPGQWNTLLLAVRKWASYYQILNAIPIEITHQH
jgi:hypothetical protein